MSRAPFSDTSIVTFLVRRDSGTGAGKCKGMICMGMQFVLLIRLLRTVRLVCTTVPVHVVRGDLPSAWEAQLAQLGVKTLDMPCTVPLPSWAAGFHTPTFQKIAALCLTQFRKVLVLDNDVVLLRNIDHLLRSPTPAFVYTPHARGINSGVAVLRPDRSMFAHARRVLALPRSNGSKGDGGDQEAWPLIFRRFFELPICYNARLSTRWGCPGAQAALGSFRLGASLERPGTSWGPSSRLRRRSRPLGCKSMERKNNWAFRW